MKVGPLENFLSFVSLTADSLKSTAGYQRFVQLIVTCVVQHIEFFHKDHFENKYHRVPPSAGLRLFIDFFWETDFDDLWKEYNKGFSDVLFPNIGYTYLINLANPFIMQAGEKKVEMRSDGFLPRH